MYMTIFSVLFLFLNQVRVFAKNVAAAFTNNPRFGLIMFSDSSTIAKQLNSCPATELSCFQNAITTESYTGGYTNTKAALDNALTVQYTYNSLLYVLDSLPIHLLSYDIIPSVL